VLASGSALLIASPPCGLKSGRAMIKHTLRLSAPSLPQILGLSRMAAIKRYNCDPTPLRVDVATMTLGPAP
jgi:hypothetical protein